MHQLQKALHHRIDVPVAVYQAAPGGERVGEGVGQDAQEVVAGEAVGD